MYNVFIIKRIMTMITLMSAILVSSAQNRFQIAFKNLKASWQIFFPAICFQSFESRSLERVWMHVWKQIAGKFLKANCLQNFESHEIAGEN